MKDVEEEMHGQVGRGEMNVLNTNLCLHTRPSVMAARWNQSGVDFQEALYELALRSLIQLYSLSAKIQSHLSHLTTLSQKRKMLIAYLNVAKNLKSSHQKKKKIVNV